MRKIIISLVLVWSALPLLNPTLDGAPAPHSPQGSRARPASVCIDDEVQKISPRTRSIELPPSSEVTLSPDGKKLFAIQSKGTSRFIGLDDGTTVEYSSIWEGGAYSSPLISPDGKHIYFRSAYSSLVVLDTVTKKQTVHAPQSNPNGETHLIGAPALSPDGKWMVSSDSSGLTGPGVILRELPPSRAKARALPLGKLKPPSQMTFSRDGKYILGNSDGQLIRWEKPFDAMPVQLKVKVGASFALSYDGKSVSTAIEKEKGGVVFQHIDLEKGNVRYEITLPRGTGGEHVTVSDDGKVAAVGGYSKERDKVQLIDLEKGGIKGEFRAPKPDSSAFPGVHRLLLTPDGRRLLVKNNEKLSIHRIDNASSEDVIQEMLSSEKPSERTRAVEAVVSCLGKMPAWLSGQLTRTKLDTFPEDVETEFKEANGARAITKWLEGLPEKKRGAALRKLAKVLVDGINDDDFTTRQTQTSALADILSGIKDNRTRTLFEKYLWITADAAGDLEAKDRLAKGLKLERPIDYSGIEPGTLYYSLLQIANRSPADKRTQEVRGRIESSLFGGERE